MCKKILIAVVAVVAGLAVLGKVTKVSPMIWFKDCCHSVQRMVPPEKQLQQLNAEIDKIDGDIKKNISRLAHMEEGVRTFEKDLNVKRTRQDNLRAEMTTLLKGLEARTEKVAFRNQTYRASEATNRLNMAEVEFTSLKEQIKAQEQILVEKQRARDAAHDRITEMKNEKEKLKLVSAKLANHLEVVRLKQMQSQNTFDFEDSNNAIARSHELAKDIEERLGVAEREAKLLKEFGYSNKNTVLEKETKSRDEVLKSARQALQNDKETEKVAEKDE
jgi:chromosome segregation ATPase